MAIKQINLHALASKDLFEATSASKREVELLSDLDHANLPHIYDRFSDPWHRYIVMDFIQGQTLEDYLSEVRRGYLSVREVLKIGIELSTVLSYLHAQFPPIIFRDVKPANIMRTRRGRLYLIDFGIARHVNRGQKDTAPLGSPGYAAPEQYGKAQTTERTDIYGLGATLQALLTGEDPWETLLRGTPPLPKQRIPKKLQQLLSRMLERDASKRPKSMEEVKQSLQSIKKGVTGLIARHALAYLCGLFIGSIPCYLLILLLLVSSPPLRSSIMGTIGYLFTLLFIALFCSWPFIFVGELVTATKFLFSSRKRFMGLGILTMIVLLIVAVLYGWVISPLLFL